MADEPVRAAVFVRGDEDRRAAEDVLRRVRPDETSVFNDMVEGYVDKEALEELALQGAAIDLLDEIEDPAEGAAQPDSPALVPGHSHAPDPQMPEMQDFKERSSVNRLGDGGVEVLSQPVDEAARPEPTDALADDVYLIELPAPIASEQRQAFLDLGISLAAFEPPASYRTFLTRDQYEDVRRLDFVSDVQRYTVEDTVTTGLLRACSTDGEEPAGPALLAEGAEAEALSTFDCVLHRIADRQAVTAKIEASPEATVLDASYLFIRFEAAPTSPLIPALAALPEVRKLAPYVAPELQLDHGRNLVGCGEINSEPPERWNGDGEMVAVFDSGIDDTHPDLEDRVKFKESVPEADSTDLYGHGTHVAGIVAATGKAADGKIRGVAPAATLAAIEITRGAEKPKVLLPVDLAQLLQRAVAAGAKIVNLSLGTQIAGAYDFGALAVDQFVWDHPDVVVVVAAGNDGVATKQGYAKFNTIGTPASAKNVITVGASATDRSDIPETWGKMRPQKFAVKPISEEQVAGDPALPAAISSRGPTDYESVKPDLLAPGTFILSTRAKDAVMAFWRDYDEHYAYAGGTSMAAPIVAGAAAIMRQYLREEKKLANPSAAVVKAVLVASAERADSRRPDEIRQKVGYPDFDQGFGRVNLAAVLAHPKASARRRLEVVDVANDSPQALESRQPPGAPRKSRRTYKTTIAAGTTEPLRVALAWTDYPGAFVQNKLHLEARGPEGKAMAGNSGHNFRKDDLDTEFFPDAFREKAGGLFDKRNNVEQVLWDAPAPGPYSFDVLAEHTSIESQGFGLCVCGELESALEEQP